MSRIGKKAVEIPDKVKVNVGNGGQVSVEGPKGKLQWTLPREIRASVQDNRVSLVREAETRSAKALHGLSRSLVYNMVQGVSEGFTKQLEIEGVGFRAAVQGSNLNLSLGFSHPVAGTAQRPRLAVHFSGKHIYAQVIDDDAGRTIAAASTAERSLLGETKGHANQAAAEVVGKAIAERSLSKNLDRVVFDRGGFLYHGKMKVLADAARLGGLKF